MIGLVTKLHAKLLVLLVVQVSCRPFFCCGVVYFWAALRPGNTVYLEDGRLMVT